MLVSAITMLVAAVISPLISAKVAHHVTQQKLEETERRAVKAEGLYQLAISYLQTVADWCSANGLTDKLPPPPVELGLDL